MSDTHFIHNIRLGIASPGRRRVPARRFLSLGAATLGLAALLPVYAGPATVQTQVEPLAFTIDSSATPAQKFTISARVNPDQTIHLARATKISLNIKGDSIELDSTNLTPDTIITVNGRQGRFGDLTPTQQQELKQAIKALPNLGAQSFAAVITDLPTIALTPRIPQSAKTLLNINGDSIEFKGIALAPDTAVKVNGQQKRFGDLTPAQQQQLRQATHDLSSIDIKLPPGIEGGKVDQINVFQSTKAILDINGDKIEIDSPAPTSDTVVKVNGQQRRFGSLTPAQQKQILDAESVSLSKVAPDMTSTIIRDIAPAFLTGPEIEKVIIQTEDAPHATTNAKP